MCFMNTEFLCSQYLMQEQGETQILCLPPGVQKVKTIELLFVLIVSVRDDLELDKTNILILSSLQIQRRGSKYHKYHITRHR